MTSQDPWQNIATPSVPESMQAHRVDSDSKWGFFWGVGHQRERYFLFVHSKDASDKKIFPRLNGVEISMRGSDTAGDAVLSLMLVEPAQVEIFYRLCMDIVSACTTASSEKEALAIAIARSWRWHHLLRGGRDGRLSIQEQKGLIGELHVIEKILLPYFTGSDCLSAWGGPAGNPIDFEINRVGIEAKARRGGSAPLVSISSEHQLDESGLEHLYLHVMEIDRAEIGAEGSNTITEIVRRVGGKIGDTDRICYEELLAAVGFRWEDDYSEYCWFQGQIKIYGVYGGFPRITTKTSPLGISNVRYSLALSDCDQYVTTEESLIERIKGTNNGN